MFGQGEVKPPPDRYYDVVGWPTVELVAWAAQPLYVLDKWGEGLGEQSYCRFDRAGVSFFLDMRCPHEIERRTDDMTWIVRVPLWVARRGGMPVDEAAYA